MLTNNLKILVLNNQISLYNRPQLGVTLDHEGNFHAFYPPVIQDN